MASLLMLPNDLLLEIADHLPQLRDINSLLLANRFLSQLLSLYILRRALSRRTSPTKRSTLHWAASHGKCDHIRKLVALNRDFVRAQVNDMDSNKLSPLDSAAINGHIDAVELLLENGADVKIPEQTVHFHFTLFSQSHNILRVLLRAGVDVNIGCEFMDEYFKHTGTYLHRAVLLNDPVSVRLLVEAGANMEAKEEGFTPLEMAYLLKHHAAVHALVDMGLEEIPLERIGELNHVRDLDLIKDIIKMSHKIDRLWLVILQRIVNLEFCCLECEKKREAMSGASTKGLRILTRTNSG